MEPITWILLAVLVLAVVLGPKFGADSRPGPKDPNVKPRPTTGGGWDWRSPWR